MEHHSLCHTRSVTLDQSCHFPDQLSYLCNEENNPYIIRMLERLRGSVSNVHSTKFDPQGILSELSILICLPLSCLCSLLSCLVL